MRIALVSQGFGPSGGGQERWTFQFAESLLRRGFEVEIVCRKIHGQLSQSFFHLHRLELRGSDPYRFANAAWSVVRQLACDIVHDMGDGWGGQVLQYHGGPYSVVAEHKLLMIPQGLRHVKKVLMAFLPHYRLRYQFAREQIQRNPGMVVALSRAQADHIVRLHPEIADRIRVVRNGVDVVRYSPAWRVTYRAAVRTSLGVDERTTVFLIAAANPWLKGVPNLLRAGRILRKKGKDIHIVVAGSDPEDKTLRRVAGGAAADWVTFTGWVDDLRPFYAAADVYVHPTFFDTCSLAVLEALASGLPVITSCCNGAAEVLSEGVDGFLLSDPRDVAGLAELMERLTDKSLQVEMGKAARDKSLLHRFESNVDAFCRMYEELRPLRRAAA